VPPIPLFAAEIKHPNAKDPQPHRYAIIGRSCGNSISAPSMGPSRSIPNRPVCPKPSNERLKTAF